MKKLICLLLVVVMLVPTTVLAASGELQFEEDVYNLVTTFCGDAKVMRGFAWSANPEFSDMVIEYAKEDAWGATNLTTKARYTAYEDRLFYKAELLNLEPGTTYVYRIGDAVDDRWTETFEFTTEEENVTGFSFIGVTDPQSSSWNNGFSLYKNTLDAAIKDDPDAAFMVNLGDHVGTGTTQSQWDGYFKATRGLCESLPHMSASGNHENYYPSGETVDALTLGKLFSLQFNNPDNGKDALSNLTVDSVSKDHNKGLITNVEDTIYSFDYGNAHFAVLNSGSDYSSSDHKLLMKEQMEWLKKDLAATDKKWKIVMSHIGIFPAKTERWHARDIVLPVLQEYGVDLVLNGHDHMVARTKEELELGTTFTILASAGPKRYDPVEQADYLEVLHNTAKDQPVYFVFDVNDDRIKMVAKQLDGTVLDTYEVKGVDEVNAETNEKNMVNIKKFVAGSSTINLLVTYPDVEEIRTAEDLCYIGEAYMSGTGMYTLQFMDSDKRAGEYKIRMKVKGNVLEDGYTHKPQMYVMDMNNKIDNLSDITGTALEAKLEVINTDNGRFLCAQYQGDRLVDVDFVDVDKGDGESMTIEYKGSLVDTIKLFFWDKTSMNPHMKEVVIY